MRNNNFILLILLISFVFGSCAGSYQDLLQKTEAYFDTGNYNAAVDKIRNLVNDAGTKDKLLLLMEAGVILHTMGEYKKSNDAFNDAYDIAESIKKSVSKAVLSFITSDRQNNYTGENFERVLINFYIALNYMMLGDNDGAKRALKRLDYDLKEMKFEDMPYKQNLAARYLDAIISECVGQYNDARVEYKNLEILDPKNPVLLPSRYILALKEQDQDDINKYKDGAGGVQAFNNNMQPVPYYSDMGELVIIHEAGQAPVKVSRGRLLNDQEFLVALRAAIEIALVAQGGVLSTTAVLAMMGTAENPIPIYNTRVTKVLM